MTGKESIALSKARLERAKDCLSTSKLLLDNEDYRDSANRSYYAVFHVMRSVLALDGIDGKRHSGIISDFRRKYVKTGIFDVELSKYNWGAIRDKEQR